MGEWAPPEVHYANLPTFHAAAAVLITDPAGRVLLVKPNYRESWLMPGGYVEADEFPHDAARREVREELGLTLDIGALLAVDWAPAADPRPRAMVNLIFDGGVLEEAEHAIRLRTQELDSYAFVSVLESAQLLPAAVAQRVPASLEARRSGATRYLFGGVLR
ncbi:NUDIX domain-containing protein [Dactylosporangium sp. CA-139066]|uniref:NUDIX domain-containing protein n=1 Tax=Dactylosporangium sp. CA-139066 TaxID=3239930 RepID=UPI003D916E83